MSKISQKGGNKHGVLLLQTSLALLTVPYVEGTNCKDFGEVIDSDTNSSVSTDILKNEAGKVIDQEDNVEIKSALKLAFTDKATLDWLKTIQEGQRMLYVRYLGVNNGNHQWQWAFVQAPRQYNVKKPASGEPTKWDATHITPESAVTYTAGDIAIINTALGFAISTTVSPVIDEEVEVTENAV